MGKNAVFTQIVSLNAMELPVSYITAGKERSSGIMCHITGIIFFIEEGLLRRFSRTVFLEPCRKSDVLYVRNDIVHYSEFDALGPGIGMQPALQPGAQSGLQPGGMYP